MFPRYYMSHDVIVWFKTDVVVPVVKGLPCDSITSAVDLSLSGKTVIILSNVNASSSGL